MLLEILLLPIETTDMLLKEAPAWSTITSNKSFDITFLFTLPSLINTVLLVVAVSFLYSSPPATKINVQPFVYNQMIMYICSVIKKTDNMDDEELEKEIERLKQKIADYQRLVPLLGTSAEEEERQINIMLDDLVKLIKKRTKK